ncbi:MAG TPA: BlaI/MecI/CopY family transcriptional regulator [Longimicrobium sp.]|nr:BlaI/MecI/CopY family transcriptional regulator [Longimicrobium sp.]
MTAESHRDLTRRERQIMDSIYARGNATAAEVLDDLPDPPSYSAVRAMLRKLHDKVHLRSWQDGPRYVYTAVVPRDVAQEGALHRLVRTFFGGSPARAAAALLGMDAGEMSDEEMDELSRLIERNRRAGK